MGMFCFKSVIKFNLNIYFVKLDIVFVSFTSEFIQKVKMSRRTASAYRNVNYQELRKDDEFTDSQVGMCYEISVPKL